MSLPLWGWLAAGAAAVLALKPSNRPSWNPFKKSLRAPVPSVKVPSVKVVVRELADPPESKASNPATYGEAVVMPDDVHEAWLWLGKRWVEPFSRLANDALPPGEQGNPDFRAGTFIDWTLAFVADRGTRDALIFGVFGIGLRPNSSSGNKGEVTVKEIAAVASTTGKVVASVATGMTIVGAGLLQLGVSAGVVAGMVSVVTTAAAASGFAAAAVAVQAAIVAFFYGVLGSAEGHSLSSYLIKGAGITDDIRAAIAMRDAGARISDAVERIAVREAVFSDQLSVLNPPPEKRAVPTMKAEGLVERQRMLERWVTSFLQSHWGMPWSPVAAKVYLQSNGAIHLHGFEWLGGPNGYHIKDGRWVGAGWLNGGSAGTEASMEGQRYALAVFAGLGEVEAAWLAKKPSTRGGPLRIKVQRR